MRPIRKATDTQKSMCHLRLQCTDFPDPATPCSSTMLCQGLSARFTLIKATDARRCRQSNHSHRYRQLGVRVRSRRFRTSTKGASQQSAVSTRLKVRGVRTKKPRCRRRNSRLGVSTLRRVSSMPLLFLGSRRSAGIDTCGPRLTCASHCYIPSQTWANSAGSDRFR